MQGRLCWHVAEFARIQSTPIALNSCESSYCQECQQNLLRAIGIGSFYIVHLMHYHGLRIGVLQLADEGDADKQRCQKAFVDTPRRKAKRFLTPLFSQFGDFVFDRVAADAASTLPGGAVVSD